MNVLFAKSFFLAHLWKFLLYQIFQLYSKPFRPNLHMSILIGRAENEQTTQTDTDWYTVTYHLVTKST